MIKIIKDNRRELDKKGARIIAKHIRELLAEKDFVVLALAGGTSVSGVFENLKHEVVDWSKVHIFLVDERMVSIADEDSNYKLINDNLIKSLKNRKLISEINLHPFILNTEASDSGLSNYIQEIEKFGGYDIILLSSGEDGHIGALYPNHQSIKDESKYYIKMNDSPKPPKNRLTMSRNLVLNSKVSVLLIYGEGKKEAFNFFMDNKIDYISCPSKLVYNIKNSYVLTDIGD